MLYAEVLPAITESLKTSQEEIIQSIKEGSSVGLDFDKVLVQQILREKLKPILEGAA